MIRLASALLALTLLVTACGGGDDDDDDAGDAAGTTPAAEGQTVNVTLTEFRIEMPSSVPAGPVSFVVTNQGAVEHNFEVEGEGLEEEFDENLKPGETKTLTLDLAPGTYEVYCPVGNHEDQGMMTELAVE